MVRGEFMSSRALRIVCLAFGLLVFGSMLGGCEEQKERKRLFAAYGEWHRAVEARNADAAMKFVHSRSFEFYDSIIHKARTAKTTEVQGLTPGDRFDVLLLRHEVPPAELKKLTGEQMIRLMFERGYWSDNDGNPANNFGPLKFGKGYATASLFDYNGKPSRYNVYFLLENDSWKMDFSRSNDWFSQQLEDFAAKHNADTNAAIMAVLYDITGRRVDPKVWMPPP